MQTIHKFPLEIVGEQIIEFAGNFKILHIAEQKGIPTLWALVELDYPRPVSAIISMYGTGQDDLRIWDYKHLGTVQINGYVWHYFLHSTDLNG